MMLEPTAQQIEEGAVIQAEIIELINGFRKEGFSLEVILAGVGAGASACLQTELGPESVFRWWASMTALALATRNAD